LDNNNIYDVLNVGFGPAGIALAVAIKDQEETTGETIDWKTLFLEKASNSTWQPEMLLPETNIQHHFLRDFATPRNPRSRYTFINYLKEKNRIFSFGHIGGIPGRIEWSDYVSWVAEQVCENTQYNREVVEVQPLLENSKKVKFVKVVARNTLNNEFEEYIAKNIILSSGRKPNIPHQFKKLLDYPNLFHATQFKSQVSKLNKNENYTFTVIGSGQNAIEIILYLANEYPDSKIYSINRNAGFRLYDLGHFSNEVYFPEFTEYFYSLPKSKRTELLEEIWHTNYGAVDHDVSHSLYWKVYEESILGKKRIRVAKCTEVVDVTYNDSKYELFLKDRYSGKSNKIFSDVVILCTGFKEEKIPSLLDPLREYLCVDENGDLIISRDYQLKTDEEFLPNIFVNGLTEKTHGISDAASFSMMALKAQRILDRLNIIYGKKTEIETEVYFNDFVSHL
jgi:L-ornithine N5-monooxygenase